MGHHQPTSSASLLVSVVAIVTISCLLPNTAAGSCLQYGHSCWGAHGKRSNFPPMAPPSADFAQPEMSLAAPADEPPASWEPPEESSAQDDLALKEPWQRLRSPSHLRLGPRGVRRADDDVDYEVPPPRWIYKIMRQSASKSD
ncbi:uncharacterized protein LOC132195921 isoform X2 [Neocloeon triangulifer]|uniref:uncharacterized protein LOC132195921 isoform X2 n=1 Tax=Neocloeon triangulifer TaxID=2078957 RepID=UPI00286F6AA6|nr:uncharacterized protein LOC132195921 isoform X2 [Neocloeon triangulifer]